MELLLSYDTSKLMQEILAQAQKIAQDHIKCIEKTIVNDISDALGVNNLEQKLHPVKKEPDTTHEKPSVTSIKKQAVIKKKKKIYVEVTKKTTHK